VIDWSALAKTFGLLLISAIFLVTYVGDINLCTGESMRSIWEGQDPNLVDDWRKSKCRMNLYDAGLADKPPADGPVKLWYYILIWALVLVFSLVGFVFLLFNCSQCLVRVYSVALVACAGMIATAEVISISVNFEHLKDNSSLGDDWESWSAAYNGLNSVVALMEVFILLDIAFDAWCAEYKEPAVVYEKPAGNADIGV